MRAASLAEAIKEPADASAQNLVELETLYEMHHRVALGLAYRMLDNRADAEDVVQEAFLSVWRALGTFDPDAGSIRTWLLSIVRNRAIDVLRARRRHPECALEDDLYVVDPSLVDKTTMVAADWEYGQGLMMGLTAPQRQALHLAYFAGLSHTRIAALLGVPVGTVKGRFRLALDHLRLVTQRTG